MALNRMSKEIEQLLHNVKLDGARWDRRSAARRGSTSRSRPAATQHLKQARDPGRDAQYGFGNARKNLLPTRDLDEEIGRAKRCGRPDIVGFLREVFGGQVSQVSLLSAAHDLPKKSISKTLPSRGCRKSDLDDFMASTLQPSTFGRVVP